VRHKSRSKKFVRAKRTMAAIAGQRETVHPPRVHPYRYVIPRNVRHSNHGDDGRNQGRRKFKLTPETQDKLIISESDGHGLGHGGNGVCQRNHCTVMRDPRQKEEGTGRWLHCQRLITAHAVRPAAVATWFTARDLYFEFSSSPMGSGLFRPTSDDQQSRNGGY
jgi:hypothetical protein